MFSASVHWVNKAVYKVKVAAQSRRLHEEKVAQVVGATASEAPTQLHRDAVKKEPIFFCVHLF